MKKYKALLIVLAVIVATLSTHYALLASASNKNAVIFETLSGDDRYLSELIIEGYVDSAHYYSRVQIQDGETKHLRNSLFDQNAGLAYERLMDDYKDFMRGKLLRVSHYYEDDEQLIYVKEPDNIWQLTPGDDLPYKVDILNKSDNSVTSFTVNNKLAKETEWITLERVLLAGNELKLVSNYAQALGDQEVHLLTIDMKNKQLKDDFILEKIEHNDQIRKDLGFYNDYSYTGHEKYLAYQVSEHEARSEQVKPLAQQFMVLNLVTNEVTELDIPEQMLGDEHRIVVSGHELIIATIIDGSVVINRYNIGQDEWLTPITLQAPSKVFERTFFHLQVLNDKLYVLAQVAEGQLLTVVDAESGESLYSAIVKSAVNQPLFTFSVERYHEKVE